MHGVILVEGMPVALFSTRAIDFLSNNLENYTTETEKIRHPGISAVLGQLIIISGSIEHQIVPPDSYHFLDIIDFFASDLMGLEVFTHGLMKFIDKEILFAEALTLKKLYRCLALYIETKKRK